MFNCTTAGHESQHGLSNPRGQSLREKNEPHHQPSAVVQPVGGDDIIIVLLFTLLFLFGIGRIRFYSLNFLPPSVFSAHKFGTEQCFYLTYLLISPFSHSPTEH